MAFEGGASMLRGQDAWELMLMNILDLTKAYALLLRVVKNSN